MNKFMKSAVIPFLCGALGAILVIGLCFSIPSIKSKIIPSDISQITSSPVDTPPSIATSLSNYADTSIAVANKVLPSVVGIKVEFSGKNMFGMSSTSSAEGSGIIIREDGYILTNNHIVSDTSRSSYSQVSEANKVIVYLYNDETAYDATIVGKDDITDLAVIKIDKTGLTAATIGNSDNIKVGEFAMAIGNPLGMQSTVTCGIISAINREITDSNKTYNLIQTDAAINSGNSGGALVNSSGEVIGINTLKFAGSGVEGMGFAIPISSTTNIISELMEYNKVRRPYIGISGTAITENLSKQYNYPIGVYISEIIDFSPAQKAELKVGDVILKIDNQTVKTFDEINEIKNAKQIGDALEILISRDGKEKTVKLNLEEQP